MPEIDTDLFNFLVVAFLAILVIASVVALSLLGGVKKALDALAQRDGAGGASTSAPEVAAAPPGAPDDARAADDARRAHEEADERRRADDERAAAERERAERERAERERAEREAEEARAARAEDERARLQEAEREANDRARLQEAEREAEDALRRSRDQEEAARARHAAADDEPHEQPFERDGRWWFRRGSELLVYDERAQEWVQAPVDAGAAQPGAATEEVAAAPSEGAGSFWKCPNCGAVNGSTATSCRMCFSARP
ncbi:MAG TPA: hypothetical protein VHJ34_03020 [Actinomycetota bacterium]|nr:hypothetical protein [Actinomycetota bacterium]